MAKVLRVASLSLVCLASSVAFGQSPVLTEMYGRGVHQYFSNDLVGAFETLTAVIDAGSDDPRAYYFRGLVHSATGREAEAKSDWETAAQMEISSPKQGMVGQSLQRIQGSTRMQLEAVRQTVRLQQRNAVQAANRARYEEMKQVEPEVLRNTGGTPRVASPTAPAPAATDNPFRRDEETAAPAPTVVADDAMKDPFTDDAGAAAAATAPAPAAPATNDPFGTGAAPAPDPFGTPAAPATNDPFGAPAPAAPAAGEPDPFGAAPPAAGENPFGANPFGN